MSAVDGGGSSSDDPRVARLVATLRDRSPAEPREARSLERILALLEELPRPFEEDADGTHVTASAIVTDGRGRVVLHRHRRLGLWLQPGGHVEDGEEPAEAAVRETLEETGLRASHPPDGPELVHVDVHPTPWGHLHLDLRYLLLADPHAPLRSAPGESDDVAWWHVTEALEAVDVGLRTALRPLGTR